MKYPHLYGLKYIDIRIKRVSQQEKLMKKEIHPTSLACTVTCACGNEFTTKSTKDTMRIDICNECHPFYTGSQKIVDTAGRIEKFKKRYSMD